MRARIVLLMAFILFGGKTICSVEKQFEFGEVDYKLLSEVKEVELQMEGKGLIYSEPKIDSYLEGLEKSF